MLPVETIKKKRNGLSLSENEIADFISRYTSGGIPDYQMSAFLMAVYFQSMNSAETLALTKAMLHSGMTVDFSQIRGFKVDKHSTGGVGDKTSLILGPIVAAAGIRVPMISGRGLGHTGGTLDKLESIPGFNTQLSLERFSQVIEKNFLCFIGQTDEICPADKKIYALRDVTGTIESLPLICASIMSKKLAEGIDGLVLDVKYGSGAFMKTAEKAEELATNLMKIAIGYRKKVSAILSNMNQPLGQFAGNSLEIFECLSVLKGEKVADDTRELSLKLAGQMLWLAGASADQQAGYQSATKILESGRAYEKFVEVCQVHGGKLQDLPRPKFKKAVMSVDSGFIHSMDVERIGMAAVKLRAGRAKTDDRIEPTAGIEFHKKVGDKVSAKEPLFTIYGADEGLFAAAGADLVSALKILPTNVKPEPLILKILTEGDLK